MREKKTYIAKLIDAFLKLIVANAPEDCQHATMTTNRLKTELKP
jgi:hypothetical protein